MVGFAIELGKFGLVVMTGVAAGVTGWYAGHALGEAASPEMQNLAEGTLAGGRSILSRVTGGRIAPVRDETAVEMQRNYKLAQLRRQYKEDMAAEAKLSSKTPGIVAGAA